MMIVNAIDIIQEKTRYNKNGKSIILPQKEFEPSTMQLIVTAIALQKQNPANTIPNNSRNKMNNPNLFLYFLVFICSPLPFCKKQSKAYEYYHKVFRYIDM